MKTAAFILSIALTLSAYARASTTSGTIGVSAAIVPGSTVSVYLVRGEVLTQVNNNPTNADSNGILGPMQTSGVAPYGLYPLVRISFDMPDSWYLLKRVTWDKKHHKLFIDF